MKNLTLMTLLFCSLSLTINAADSNSDLEALKREMKSLDQTLFENTFGNCKIKEVEPLIGENFEFYHDKGGVTKGKATFMNQLKSGNCSGKSNPAVYKSFRVLHEGTLKHFPMYKEDVLYAVLQTGIHSFYETNNGGNLTRGSTAKFSHLWELNDGKWQLTRVISYDHQSPEPWKH